MNKWLSLFDGLELSDNEESYRLDKDEIPSSSLLEDFNADNYMTSTVSTTDGKYSVSVIETEYESNFPIELRVINNEDGSFTSYCINSTLNGYNKLV